MSSKKPIIIYRDHILPASETFVIQQANSLINFKPTIVGSKIVPGLKIPDGERVVLSNHRYLGLPREYLFKKFGYAPRFINKIKALNPLLIHAHFGPGGVSALPIQKQLRIPMIVTYHGFDATIKDSAIKYYNYSHNLYIKRRSELKKTGSLFICVSSFIQNKLITQGFPQNKTKVHYIGVDTEYFTPGENNRGDRLVLFVGRLVEVKGVKYLLDAMHIAQKKIPDLRLVIIGDGPQRRILESYARSVITNFDFLGDQPSDIVRTWMNQATILAGSSVTTENGAAEAFGIVYIEAQSMGLPVVGFSSGGTPEAVLHGETGLLAPEKDVITLAEYIHALAIDKLLRERLSSAGKSFVREYFNLHSQTRKLEAIYSSVIKS